MVVEADDTSDLPYSIFVLPEVNELRLADRLGILVSGMVETVNADLHRAIVGNGVYLKRPWNEFSGHLATDVVLHTLNQSLPSAAQAALVMIELQIVGQQRSEFLQIAMVVGIEKFGIQRPDRLKQRAGCRRSLSMDMSQGCSKQSCKKNRLQRSKDLFHEGIPFCEDTQLLLRLVRPDWSTQSRRLPQLSARSISTEGAPSLLLAKVGGKTHGSIPALVRVFR